MGSIYRSGQRSLQAEFDSTRLADRIEAKLVRSALTESDAAFIAARDMFFLATADAEGRPTCSYKGGDPGFVRVLDPSTLAFPSYDGNGMFLSLGNVLENANVGMLFIDFERPSRLRAEGVAEVSRDDPLLAEFPEAQLLVRVRLTRVYPNCPRYIHRHVRAERSEFVPREGCETPVPGWKRSDWASDVLPKKGGTK
jgi:predicted pyridoxine 5'-phosphate oxidase superfamily flavin-nucleotide-binding protein